MPNPKVTPGKQQRDAHLRWVPIAAMRVSEIAQRELNPARVDRIAANFDPEDVGTPTVSHRGEHFFIIDGQHRIAAMKAIGWDDQQIQCWTYEGMTEEEEAERFLKLNDNLAVSAMSKFRVSVAAGRARECDIDRIVRINDCVVSHDKSDGAIGAVGTLGRIYDRAGAKTLGRTIRIAHAAYGDPGLDAAVLDGIGALCQRYNGQLDDDAAIERLSSAAGGTNGLLSKAEALRRRTGVTRGHCVAATAVELINRGRGGKKLPDWFKTDA